MLRRSGKPSSLPLHLQLDQLERSLTSTISGICERVTLLESIVLKEFGSDRIKEHYSILGLLKSNFRQLHRQSKGNETDVVKVEINLEGDDDEEYFRVDKNNDLEDFNGFEEIEESDLDYDGIRFSNVSSQEKSHEGAGVEIASHDGGETSNSQMKTRSGRPITRKFASLKNESQESKSRSDTEDWSPHSDKNTGSPKRRSSNVGRPGNKSTVCDECGACFANGHNLRVHRKTHRDVDKFKCDQCGSGFRTQHKLDVHKRHFHEDRPYQCEVCFAKFKGRGQMLIHLRVHSDNRKFACKEKGCDKSFKHTTGLIRHMLVHKQERPYACPICPKRYYETNKVRRHIAHAHKELDPLEFKPERVPKPPKVRKPDRRKRKYPRIICDQCGRGVLSRGYRHHLQTHDNTRFLCPVCPKGFPTEGAMNRHQRLAHDPDRPFKCERPDCDERFKMRSTLKVHMERHKPNHFGLKHACQECGVQYKHVSTLRYHINAVHTHETLFPCVKCLGIYHTKCHLKRHLLMVHKVDTDELKELLLENTGSGREIGNGHDFENSNEQIQISTNLDQSATGDATRSQDENSCDIEVELDPADVQQIVEI